MLNPRLGTRRKSGICPPSDIVRRFELAHIHHFAFRTDYQVVNVGDLEARFETGAHVTPEAILEVGLIRNLRNKVKVLGNGEVTKKLKIEASKFSKSAEEKIKGAGGEIVVL